MDQKKLPWIRSSNLADGSTPNFFENRKKTTVEIPESPVGKVSSVLSDGSVTVHFPRLDLSFNGKTFEIRKNVNGAIISVGLGTIQIRGPGQIILIPGSDGLLNPSIGDTVHVYEGDPLPSSINTLQFPGR